MDEVHRIGDFDNASVPNVLKVAEVGEAVDEFPKQQSEMETSSYTDASAEAADDNSDDNSDDESLSNTGEPLNYELQQGYRILKELMADSNKAVNWPFLDPVDREALDSKDYYERIKNPMWLRKMESKFQNREYASITEFVIDFRLMLENCYRYNGPDHYISRRGQKFETMLEQKLALLSRELRAKTSIAATSGHMEEDVNMGLRRRSRAVVAHDSTALLNMLREEEAQRERESRRQQIQVRKAEKEAYLQELLEWEEKKLFQGKLKEQMKAMWEIPQISLFLFLCQTPLNLGEIPHFELERCFMMPRESSTMQQIMTSLLSTPFQRTRFNLKNLMPYNVWEEKLRTKMQPWYKLVEDSSGNTPEVAYKLGLDEKFFQVVGNRNPLEKKKYHQLSFYRRVWIVKGLCDHIVETQESLREMIESHALEDQRDYHLGMDADGYTYHHFPQFCGADLRIYRQAPIKYPKYEVKLAKEEMAKKRKNPMLNHQAAKKLKKKRRVIETPAPVLQPSRQRPSRLRQTIKAVVPLQLNVEQENVNSSEEGDDEGEKDEEEGQSSSSNEEVDEETEESRLSGAETLEDHLSHCSDSTIPYGDKSDTDSHASSSQNCSRESSPPRRRQSQNIGPYSSRKRVRLKLEFPNNSSVNSRDELDDESLHKHMSGEESILSQETKDDSYLDDNSKFSENSEGKKICDTSSNIQVNSREGVCFDGKELKCKTEPGLEFEVNSNNNSALQNESDAHRAFDWVDFKDVFSAKRTITPDVASCNLNSQGNPELFEQSSDSMNFQIGNNLSDSGFLDLDKSADSGMDNRVTNEIKRTKEISDGGKFAVNVKEQASGTKCVSLVPNSICKVIKCESMITLCRDDISYKSTVLDANNGSGSMNTNAESNKHENLDSRISDDTEKSQVSNNFININEIRVKEEPLDFLTDSVVGLEHNYQLPLDRGNTSFFKYSHEDGDYIHENANQDMESFSLPEVEFSRNGLILSSDMASLESSLGCTKTVSLKKENVAEDLLPQNQMNDRQDEQCSTQKDTDGKKGHNSDSTKKYGVKKEVEEEDDDEAEMVPDLGEFELIVDSVERLRELTQRFEEPEPMVIKKGKKEQIIKPPPRKRCVVELHKRLSFLLTELEPWESKLVKATEKARTKMQKEYEEFQEEPEEKGWDLEEEEMEEENSGSSVENTETEEDEEEEEDGGSQEEGLISKGDDSNMETDISSRGRIRKRRIIPNNVEDQIAPKKAKLIIKSEQNAESVHIPAILQRPENSQTPGKVILNCSNLLQTLKGVPITNMLGGHIVLTSQGGQTVLATINPENAPGLRLLQTSSLLPGQHIKVKTELSTSSTSSPLAGSNQLQSNSLLSSKHPTIQMLLSKTSPGQGIVRTMEQLSSTAAATRHGTLIAKSLLGTANLQIRPKPPETVTATAGVSSQTPQSTVQKTHVVLHSPPMQKAKNNFYMANVNSLPLSVLKQLMKTKGVKVQYGPNQQGVVFIPTSLFSSAHQSTASTVMTDQTTEPPPVSLNARGQAAIISPCLGGQTSGNISVISPQPASSSCQLLTSTTADQLSSRTTASSVGLNTGYILLPASSSVTVVNPVIKAVSSESSGVLPEKSSLPGGLQSDMISGPSVSANPLASSTSIQILTTDALNSSGKQVPKVIRISSPGTNEGKSKDPPSSDETSVSTSTLTNAEGSAPVVVTLYEKDLVKQPCKYATNLTVKHLLLKRRSFDDKEKSGTQQILSTTATTITGSLSSPTLISTHRPLLSPSTATTVQSTCVLTTISPAKLNTLLMQTNAAGAKTIPPLIKLPSKAVLDSAVQAVVTSVNTSLPTANIKVPSPVTLPSMQPRRNVTKTIQSMKYPIPVTPKVESKSAFKPSAAGLEQSVGSGQVSLQTAGTLTTTQTLLPTSVGLLQVAQQPKNISTPQVQYSQQVLINSQGILQGVLTPQGLMVPQTPQIQMQGVTQPGAAQLLAQMGMQSMNTGNISSSPSGISLSSGGRSGQSPVRLLPNSLIPNCSNILQQSQLGTLKPSDVKTTSIIIPQVVNPSVFQHSMTGASVKCSKATAVPISESSVKFPISQKNTSDTLSAGKSIVKKENQTFEIMSQAVVVTKGTGIKEVFGPVTSKTVCVKSQNSIGSNLGHNASVVYTNTKTMPVLSSSVANQQTVLALKSPQTSGGNTMIIPQQNIMQASVSPVVNIPQGFILQGSATGIPLASPVLQPIPSVNLAAGYSQATMLQQPTVNLLQSPVSPVPVLNRQILTAVQQMQHILHPSQQEALMKPPPVTKVLIPPNLISAAQKDGQQVTSITTVAQSNIKTEPQLAGMACAVSDSKTLPIPSLLVQGQNTTHSPTVPIQTTASKLIKQLSNSSLQSKLNQSNVPSQSLPEVKPVLLSQQLNTATVSSPAKVTPFNLIAPKSGKLGSKAGQTFVLSSPQKTSIFSQNSHVTSPSKGPLFPLLTPTSVNFGSVIKNSSSTDKSASSLGNISTQKQILLLPKNTVAKGTSSSSVLFGDSVVSSSIINSQESANTAVSSISVIEGTSASIKTNMSVDDPKEKPQKITLFSIGGQLVTGQGVPVTLDNGVLKLMPKAKVQINNQTLTPKQIQETLAKIGKMTIPSFAGQKVKANQGEGSEASSAGITFSPGVRLFKSCVKTETNTAAQDANVLQDTEEPAASKNFKIVDTDTKPALQSPLKKDHLTPPITQGNVFVTQNMANAAQKTDPVVRSSEVNPKGIIGDVQGLKVLKQGDSTVVQSASNLIEGPSYFIQGNVPQAQSSATILKQGPGAGDGIVCLIKGTANIPQQTPILLPAYTVSGNAKVGMEMIQKFSNKEQGMNKHGQNKNPLVPGVSKQSQYGNIVAQTTTVQIQPAIDSSKEELGSAQTVETSAEGRSQQASNLQIDSGQSANYAKQVHGQVAPVQQTAKSAVMKLQSGVTEIVNSKSDATTVHPIHQETTGAENIKQNPTTKSSVAHSTDAAFFTEFKHSGNVHFVLKPMISSTGYIVCPRITNISQCTKAQTKSHQESSSSQTGTVFEKSTEQDKTVSITHPMKTGASNTNPKQTLLALKLPATASISMGFVHSAGSTSTQASTTESQPQAVDRETEDVLTIDLGNGDASNIEKSRSLLIPSIRRKSENIVQQTPIKETSIALNINSDVQEKNEQEAALNLLTLANQASNR